jgi:predicted nucleic-acid-binding protein
MIALDTNVLVRFLVRDDEGQHARAAALLQRGIGAGEAFFVADVVLAEVVWVLQSRYRLDRRAISEVLRALTEAEHLHFESAERTIRAWRRFRDGRGGFADYLIAERARDEKCDVVATFDGELLSEPGFVAP